MRSGWLGPPTRSTATRRNAHSGWVAGFARFVGSGRSLTIRPRRIGCPFERPHQAPGRPPPAPDQPDPRGLTRGAPSETASPRPRSPTARRSGRSGAAPPCRPAVAKRATRRGARRRPGRPRGTARRLPGEIAQLQVVHDPALHRARARGHARRRDQPRRRHLQPGALELALPRGSGAEVSFIASRSSQVTRFQTNSPQLAGEGGRVLGPEAREGEHRRRLADRVEEAVGGEVDRPVRRQGRDPADRARRHQRLERIVGEAGAIARVGLVEDHPRTVSGRGAPRCDFRPRAGPQPRAHEDVDEKSESGMDRFPQSTPGSAVATPGWIRPLRRDGATPGAAPNGAPPDPARPRRPPLRSDTRAAAPAR